MDSRRWLTEADVRAVIEKAFDYLRRRGRSRAKAAAKLRDIFLTGALDNAGELRGAADCGEQQERPAISYSEIAANCLHRTRQPPLEELRSLGRSYGRSGAAGEKNISIEPEALE